MPQAPDPSNVENQIPRDTYVPPTADTRQEPAFDREKLYSGLQELVDDTVASTTQAAAINRLGFPNVNLIFEADEEDDVPEVSPVRQEGGSANQGDQQYFTSTTDDTDPFTAAANEMIDSGDETQQRRGQRLQEMLASDNQADNDSARAIVNMLGSDDYHQIAQTMLDVFATPEINTMVELLNDENRQAEAQTIVGMMTGSENRPADPFSAQRLLGMIGSEDGDTRATGERLLSMLGDEDESQVADRLLGLNDASIQQFLQIYDDPEQEDLANQLTDLLTSEDNTEFRAGVGILSMMTSDDGTERYAGATLAEMLTDPDQRDNAIAIAGNLDTPQQRMQMLELLDNPAGEHLIEMLGNEEQARSVVTLLNLLGSPFEMDRRDGGNLLNMLSTEARGDAERVLDIWDPQSRHHLTEMLANPATQSAGTQLLNMLDSPQRRERAAANNFLQSMESTQASDRERNNRLISLLSNENTSAAARTMLTAFGDEPRALDQALTLLQTNPDHGRMVATMLGGTPQERSAARTLIDMRVNEGVAATPPRPRPGDRPVEAQPANPEQPQAPRPSDQMLRMLANQNDRPQALTILSSLNAQQASTLMGLRETHPNAFNHMTTMLQDSGRQSAVRNFLQVTSGQAVGGDRPKQNGDGRLQAPGPAAVESVQQVLRMLNNPQDAQGRQTAETLMAHLSTSEQYANMTRLMAAPGFQAEARQITQMLADPNRSSEAGTILSNLTQPAQIRTMLNLLGDENRRHEAQQVLRMLPDGSGSRLLDMIGSANETTSQTGRDLLTMLGTDNYFDAQNILSAQATPEQAQVLMNLLADRETAPAARQLLNRLGLEPNVDPPGPNPVRLGAETLLSMLGRDGATGQAARQILTMLGSQTDSRQADAILSLGRSESMQAVLGVLNDPNRRQAAEQLRTLLGSTEPGSPALQNLSALMSGDMPAEGARLIEMLNTPAQQAAANNILRRVSNPAQAQQVLRMLSQEATRPVAEQLLQMLQSPQNAQSRAAENWLSVLSNPTDDTRAGINHINEMLADPQRRAQAITILSGLENDAQQRQLATLLGDRNNPGVQQLMQMLISGDQRQVEGVRNLLGLRTQESFNRPLVPAPGDAPAPVPTSTQLLQMLANPETQSRARDIMSAGGAPEQLNTLLRMSQNPQYAESLNGIFTALRNPDQAQAMRAVLNRINDPSQLNQMVQLMNDANYSRAAQTMTSILQNEEQNPFGVVTLMGMLASPNAETRQAGRALLDMLNSDDDSDRERNAGDILNANLPPQSITQLMNIMRNPALQFAQSEIMEMLRDDDGSAGVLFQMLQSTNPAEQEQGRRLLSQLNSFSTAGYAMRSLATRAFRSTGKG